MLDFLDNNSNEILTMIISIILGISPIPFILREIRQTSIETFNPHKFINKKAKYKIKTPNIVKHTLDSTRNITSEPTKLINATIPPKSESYLISKTDSLKELREKRHTDKFLKKTSFALAVTMSVIGTIILFFGIIINLFTEKEVIWITTSSGAIIEVIAGVYFWLLNRTMKEVNNNSKQLEQTEDLLTAIELTEKISDPKTKDETYKNMINTLLSKSYK